MNKYTNLISLIFISITLSGCLKGSVGNVIFGKKDNNTPGFNERKVTYHTYVNSINDGEEYKNKKYIIMPGLKGLKKSSLQFKEFSNYLNRAMKKAGYIQASNTDEADIGILFAYGIGEPEKETSYTSSSYTNTIPSYYNYSAITTTSVRKNTTVSFTRNIILDAYDLTHFKNTGEEKQVWLTKATSTGSKGDLREVLPVIITSIIPYIGSNTKKVQKTITITPSIELYEILGKPIPSN